MQNLLEQEHFTSQELQLLFLSLLHHDHRKGRVALRAIRNNKIELSTSETNLKHLIINPRAVRANTYVSVNAFHKSRFGESMRPYCINAMFFDLDGHKFKSKQALEQAKANTYRALREAAEEGKIGYWTICNDTGRGLQIFYILNRSISVIPSTKKMLNFFDATYKDLTNRIKEIVDDYPGETLDVDMCVRDRQRICRLPETFNYKPLAGPCYILDVNLNDKGKIIWYSLSQLAAMVGFDQNAAKIRKLEKEQKKDGNRTEPLVPKKHKESNIDEFLKNRMKQLELIQKMRDDWTGLRQTFCFIYFNTVYQIMSHMDATAALRDFNQTFGIGIEPAEIQNIIREVNRHGAYKFTSQYIINALGLSKQEINRSGIAMSSERKEQHENMITFKKKRDELVVSLICRGMKYADVVNVVNKKYQEAGVDASISLRTVNNIAKRYNCGHYFGAIKDEAEVDSFTLSYKEGRLEAEKSVENSFISKNAKNVMYKGVVIKNMNQNISEAKKYVTNKTETTKIPGINFMIQFEDMGKTYVSDEERMKKITETGSYATDLLKAGNYRYAMSFLRYIKENVLEREFLQTIEEFDALLCNCANEQLVQDIFVALSYIALEYEMDPELHVAVYDIEALIRCIRHKSMQYMKLHGTKIELDTVFIPREYPDIYEPKSKTIESLELLKQSIFEQTNELNQYSDAEKLNIMDAAEDVIYEIEKITQYKTFSLHITDETVITMQSFYEMIRELTEADIIFIAEKALQHFYNTDDEYGSGFYIKQVYYISTQYGHKGRAIWKFSRILNRIATNNFDEPEMEY